jgi:hypothetical protein
MAEGLADVEWGAVIACEETSIFKRRERCSVGVSVGRLVGIVDGTTSASGL